MRVFGQLAAMDCTWAVISLAPGTTAMSAGQLTPYTPTDTLTLERSELTSASPTAPTPGGSCRPRAKTTSASGHAADADGISAAVEKGVAAGVITNAAASAVAAARLRTRRAPGVNAIRLTTRYSDYQWRMLRRARNYGAGSFGARPPHPGDQQSV